jgi:hypothetical protein
MYCATCEAVYNLPQGGAIKLYKEITCPLDGFELVLFPQSALNDFLSHCLIGRVLKNIP